MASTTAAIQRCVTVLLRFNRFCCEQASWKRERERESFGAVRHSFSLSLSLFVLLPPARALCLQCVLAARNETRRNGRRCCCQTSTHTHTHTLEKSRESEEEEEGEQTRDCAKRQQQQQQQQNRSAFGKSGKAEVRSRSGSSCLSSGYCY